MRPEFLVIGGMKCGTSALWQYLRQHPQLFLAPKNIDYFNDANWQNGPAWYEGFFPEADCRGKRIGEISTEYTKYPHRCGAPARLAQTLPEARLVYIVRHPVKRMISHYIHNVGNLSEDRPPQIALEPGEDNAYLNFSRYYLQIEQYLPYFEPQRIRIIRSEDLRAHPQETLDALLDFVGLPPLAQVTARDVHTREEKRAWNRLGRYIRRSPRRFDRFNYYLGKLPPALGQLVLRATGRPVALPPLPEALRARIVEALQPDVERLYAFAGPGFRRWTLDAF